jgi:predicted site-specific integrase-resolvase
MHNTDRVAMKSKKTYSTPQAAKKIGVSFITLHRWLKCGKIRPQAIPLQGRTLWLWSEADIAKGRKVKAEQKPGPKRKERKR